jgi:hypothetical protein
MPKPAAAAMPPMLALSGPQLIPATISGSGASTTRTSEIGSPEISEANIRAEAAPAASAMAMNAIISCPAPFERLEVPFDPNHRRPERPGSLMNQVKPTERNGRRPCGRRPSVS